MAVSLNPAAFGMIAILPLLLLFGGIMTIVVILGAVVWLAVAVGSKGTSPAGGQTIFDLALTVHRELESCDARVERLESRLLASFDSATGGTEKERL